MHTPNPQSAHYRKLYDSMLAENPERMPDSDYWLKKFQAVALKLALEMGIERYRAWFDIHFPATKLFTWRAQYNATAGALKRIQNQQPEDREIQIQQEMNISIDEENYANHRP